MGHYQKLDGAVIEFNGHESIIMRIENNLLNEIQKKINHEEFEKIFMFFIECLIDEKIKFYERKVI